jgi:electron transport complex protein RnfC
MHSGAAAKPVVAVGDLVKVGQLVGEMATGRVSSPVHSSVSGKVKAIDEFDPVTGRRAVSVVITTDGEQAVYEGLAPPVVTDTAGFLQAVSDSGVVGLGGAGYPTAPKLTLKEGTNLDYILVNGAECEPYITSDTRTMVDAAEDVFEGSVLMKKYLNPKEIRICIEDNKPEAIKLLRGLCGGVEGINVHVLPSEYPQGERKVLVYNVTNRIVPEGGRLTDVGCIVINCTTVAVFARYIKTGKPLVERVVTVDGSAVRSPKNVVAPIGTPIKHLFEYCGLGDDVKKVIMGGPMMGAAVPSMEMPVVKVTNAILALTAKDSVPPVETACIRCGRCIEKCPMDLMPSFIEDAFLLKRVDLLNKYKVNMCAECGCCAYLCPAKRPLAQVMVLSKNMQWEAGRK